MTPYHAAPHQQHCHVDANVETPAQFRQDRSHVYFFIPRDQPLHFPDSTMPIRLVTQHKHLGVMFECKLSWAAHINCVCKRSSSALGVLQPHCTHLPIQCKLLFYQCYILPIFDYCDTAWCGLSDPTLNQLKVHHRFILKILYNKDRCFPSDALYRLSHTSPLSVRHKHHLCTLVQKNCFIKPLHT